MNDTKPLVSVCCITYNHANYIRDAIEGFLMQKTTFPIEILIHDDASTDGTAEIVKGYAEKHPDLIFPIFQKENQYSKGKKPNQEFNFPRARGKYIALCEGDDYWINPLKLQKQVEFLNINPDYYLVAGKTLIKNKNNITIREMRWNKRETAFDVLDYICNIFFHTSTICCRNNYHGWQNYPGSKILQGDQYFVLFESLPQCNKIKFLDEVLSVYRIHPGGITNSIEHNNLDRSVESYIFILESFNLYSKKIYEFAIKYRIKEVSILKTLKNEQNILLKSHIAIQNNHLLLKYLMRKLFGIRPF